MVFCVNCGAKSPDEARFCAGCGTKIVLPDQTQTQTAEPTPSPEVKADPITTASPTINEELADQLESKAKITSTEGEGEVPTNAPKPPAGKTPSPTPESSTTTTTTTTKVAQTDVKGIRIATTTTATAKGTGTGLICPACNKEIPSNDSAVGAFGKKWHKDCFKCSKCGDRIYSFAKFFAAPDGRPICAKCHNKKAGQLCAGCGKPVGSKFISAMGLTYHEECMKCAGCGKRFTEEGFFEDKGKLWHLECATE